MLDKGQTHCKGIAFHGEQLVPIFILVEPSLRTKDVGILTKHISVPVRDPGIYSYRGLNS
jgi:hypothetical protein